MANPALIDELEKQFRDNPRRVFARLANEYRKAGDYVRAIEICHAHVPQQPGYISGHIVLGQALYDAGEMDQAHETFQTALALDPENLIALRQLGDIARGRSDFGEARSWYTRLLDVDPQNEEIVAQLGELALEEEPAHRNGATAHAGESGSEPEPAAAMEVDTADETVAAAEETEAESADADEPSVERLTIDTPAESAYGRDEGEPASADVSDHEVPELIDMLGIDDEAEDAFVESPDEEPVAAAAAEPRLEDMDPEDDVAWVVAEGEGAIDEALVMDDVTEIEATEVVMASDPSPEGEAAAEDSDFDFTFESEEFDAPLRPHTGESLSVIAEEDALAGVHATHRAEPSPFGDSVDEVTEADMEAEEFEPLPSSEIEAAAEPRPTDDDAAALDEWPPETPSAALDAAPSPAAETPGDAFDLGDAATLVEDDTFDDAWADAPRFAAPAASEPDETHAASDDATEEVTAEAAPALDEESVDEAYAEPDDAAAFSAVLRENEPDAGPQEDSAVPEAEPEHGPAAFVTETMAELYLKQGFRNEAIDVYRKLVAQSPGDEVFRARLEELEQGAAAPAEASEGTVAPPAASLDRPAGAFFKALASVPAPVTPATAMPVVEPPRDKFADWANEALAKAGDVEEADDAAAMALASGYAPEPPRPPATRAAQGEMSLNDIFGKERAARATPGALDAFLTPEGEPAAARDAEDAEDLEAFNAWLEGLKK